jgi:hypothetical protein
MTCQVILSPDFEKETKVFFKKDSALTAVLRRQSPSFFKKRFNPV